MRNETADSALISISEGRGGARQGAGRPPSREVVEDFVAADIRDWWWSRDLEQLRRGSTDAPVRLHLGQGRDAGVEVTTSPGGACPKHAWFVCPGCGRRAAKLYLRAEDFRCRRCHGLVYRSQRAGLFARASSLKRKMHAQLAPGALRPAGMHRAVYERYLTALLLAETLHTQAICARWGPADEADRMKEGACQLREIIRRIRHRAGRARPRGEQCIERLLAKLAV